MIRSFDLIKWTSLSQRISLRVKAWVNKIEGAIKTCYEDWSFER
jgi:hypothetical protein